MGKPPKLTIDDLPEIYRECHMGLARLNRIRLQAERAKDEKMVEVVNVAEVLRQRTMLLCDLAGELEGEKLGLQRKNQEFLEIVAQWRQDLGEIRVSLQKPPKTSSPA